MADDRNPAGKSSSEEAEEALQWLLEPAAPGEVKIRIEIGEGAELAPEIREAVDALAKAIQDQEVAGYNQWSMSLQGARMSADFVRVCSACGTGGPTCNCKSSHSLGFGSRSFGINPATFRR